MPTYEYQCAKGHEFERFQKISDARVSRCPECGAKAQRKISGGQGLIFKGSGFYITDYGKDGKGPRKEESSSSEPKSDTKKATSSEAEPKTKAKPKPTASDSKAAAK